MRSISHLRVRSVFAGWFLAQVKFSKVVNSCVLWKIVFDPKRGCKHVNLVASHVPDEFEFLFSSYSAFEVKSVRWSKTPQDYTRPHEITLLAAPDNKNDEDFPEYLPLAPWS